MKKLSVRLAELELIIQPKDPLPPFPDLQGGIQEMRLEYADWVARLVAVSRAKNFPEHPQYADRLLYETRYSEQRQQWPERFRADHPVPLTEVEVEVMTDAYHRHHQKAKP